MSYRERLIFRLIRRVAHLLGNGKQFDAECDRIALLTAQELEDETDRKMKAIKKALEEE